MWVLCLGLAVMRDSMMHVAQMMAYMKGLCARSLNAEVAGNEDVSFNAHVILISWLYWEVN